MPDWVVPLLAFLALVGFIGFAFRQGMRVKPDRDNPDNWQSSGGGQSPGDDGSHQGFNGQA
jgi:hypothetical protein